MSKEKITIPDGYIYKWKQKAKASEAAAGEDAGLDEPKEQYKPEVLFEGFEDLLQFLIKMGDEEAKKRGRRGLGRFDPDKVRRLLMLVSKRNIPDKITENMTPEKALIYTGSIIVAQNFIPMSQKEQEQSDE